MVLKQIARSLVALSQLLRPSEAVKCLTPTANSTTKLVCGKIQPYEDGYGGTHYNHSPDKCHLVTEKTESITCPNVDDLCYISTHFLNISDYSEFSRMFKQGGAGHLIDSEDNRAGCFARSENDPEDVTNTGYYCTSKSGSPPYRCFCSIDNCNKDIRLSADLRKFYDRHYERGLPSARVIALGEKKVAEERAQKQASADKLRRKNRKQARERAMSKKRQQFNRQHNIVKPLITNYNNNNNDDLSITHRQRPSNNRRTQAFIPPKATVKPSAKNTRYFTQGQRRNQNEQTEYFTFEIFSPYPVLNPKKSKNEESRVIKSLDSLEEKPAEVMPSVAFPDLGETSDSEHINLNPYKKGKTQVNPSPAAKGKPGHQSPRTIQKQSLRLQLNKCKSKVKKSYDKQKSQKIQLMNDKQVSVKNLKKKFRSKLKKYQNMIAKKDARIKDLKEQLEKAEL